MEIQSPFVFTSSSLKTSAFAGLLLTLGLFLQGCSEENEGTTTGSAGGAIRLINQTPSVESYLAGHPVINDVGSSVMFFPDGVLVPPVPSVSYNAMNSGETVASYTDLQPPLMPGENLFHPELNYLRFQADPLFGEFGNLVELPGGSQSPRYRLGSRRAESPASQDCTVTEGVTAACALEECAVRANLNLQLEGSDEDLGLLLPAVACSVVAKVVEGGGSPSPQAYSGAYAGLVSEMANGGMTVPMLVRGSGQPITFSAGCIAKPTEEDSGFVTGASGFTVFPLPPQLASTESSANCGEDLALTISIPVLRQSGGIKGLFDLSGVMEDSAEVRIKDLDSVFKAEPDPVASNAIPTNPWEIPSAPVGEYGLYARALLEGKRHYIEFPHRDTHNGKVNVVDGMSTDLKTSFVAQPHVQAGQMRLFDPSENTDLGLLTLEPFDRLNDATSTSFISARGVSEQGNTCMDGGFGTGGKARNVLSGSFNNNVEWLLDFELYLTGLSPLEGNPDGSDMRCTPWEMDQLHLVINDTTSGIRQRNRINLLDNLGVEAQAGDSQIYPEPLEMCFGQLELDIVANQGVGSIHSPTLSVHSTGLPTSANGDLLSTAYSLDRGFVSAPPRNNEESAGLVHLRATLPERIQYRLDATVDLVSTGGVTTSDVELESLVLPAGGQLACGAIEKACIEVNDPSGTSNPLSISVAPQSAYCQQDGDLNLSVEIHSGNAEVSFASAELFAVGNQTPLPGGTECAPCGASPTLTPGLNNLAPGNYELHASAFSETGLCSAELVHVFQVATQPVGLSCPPAPEPIQLAVGEDSIAGDDPLIESLLNLPITGGCSDIDYSREDNRPDEFFPGTTLVTVSTPASEASCEVPISVTAASVQGLVYMVGETAQYFDMSLGLTTLSTVVDTDSLRSRVSVDGSRALFVPAGSNAAGLVFDFENNSFQSLPGERGVWGRFDPANPERLATISNSSDPDAIPEYNLVLHQGGTTQSIFIAGNDPLISEPRLAWRPDSGEIIVAYTRRNQTSALTDPDYRLVLKSYPLNNGSLGAPYTISHTLPTPREELSDIAYLDNQTLVMVSV